MSNKQIHIDLNAMPLEKCECGEALFNKKTLLKRIPALLSGNKQDTFVPVEVFCCDKCGVINPATCPVKLEEEGE